MKAAQLRRTIYDRRGTNEASIVQPETAFVPREFNILALIKGEERYVFVYDDDSRTQLIDSLRDQAADPGLTLTWFDAAVLTEKAREQAIANLAKEKTARHRNL